MNGNITELRSQLHPIVNIHLSVQHYKHMSTQLNDYLWRRLRGTIRYNLTDSLDSVIYNQLESAIKTKQL